MGKAIEISNLNYSYPDGTQALFGINLDVFEGESLGIVGPNGAGKSTLLLHLNGILKGEGQIRVLGLEMNDRNLNRIRMQVGLVFQDPDSQLFMPTVFDDVSFGPVNMGLTKDEVIVSVNKSLNDVDMLASLKRPSHHLSFGEKKRVSIATVLAMRPQILVLDEPSSNLDSRHRRDLINLLDRLTPVKIIATHDLDLVSQVCSRVALLDNGRIITEGKTKDILENKLLLQAHNL